MCSMNSTLFQCLGFECLFWMKVNSFESLNLCLCVVVVKVMCVVQSLCVVSLFSLFLQLVGRVLLFCSFRFCAHGKRIRAIIVDVSNTCCTVEQATVAVKSPWQMLWKLFETRAPLCVGQKMDPWWDCVSGVWTGSAASHVKEQQQSKEWWWDSTNKQILTNEETNVHNQMWMRHCQNENDEKRGLRFLGQWWLDVHSLTSSLALSCNSFSSRLHCVTKWRQWCHIWQWNAALFCAVWHNTHCDENDESLVTETDTWDWIFRFMWVTNELPTWHLAMNPSQMWISRQDCLKSEFINMNQLIQLRFNCNGLTIFHFPDSPLETTNNVKPLSFWRRHSSSKTSWQQR